MTALGQKKTDPRAGSTQTGVMKRWDIAWCFVLILIAIALRGGALGPSSLWRDDAWQALVVRTNNWAEVARIGVTAPGFAMLLKLWLCVVGFSSTAAQALPFAAGVAAAPLGYLLAKRIGFGMAGALATGIALTISPLHIIYSTRVKPFTIDADLSILVLFLSATKAEKRTGHWRLHTLVVIATLATIFSASTLPVVLTAVVVTIITSRPPEGSQWAPRAALLSLLLFFITWWAFWLRPMANEYLREFWAYSFIPLNKGIQAAVEVAWIDTTYLLDGLTPLPVPLTVAFIALGTYLLVRRAPWLVALLLGPPAIALVAASIHLSPYGGGRTDIYLYPCLALLFAAPIDELCRLLPQRTAVIGFLAALAPLVRAHPTEPYPAEDIRPIVRIVEAEAQKGDAVIVYPSDGYIYALYSRFEVRIVKSDLSLTGFTVTVDHPGVTTLILVPHSDDPFLQQYERGLRQNVVAIRWLVFAQRRPLTVWLVARSDASALSTIESILQDAALARVRSWKFPGAVLTLWRTDS